MYLIDTKDEFLGGNSAELRYFFVWGWIYFSAIVLFSFAALTLWTIFQIFVFFQQGFIHIENTACIWVKLTFLTIYNRLLSGCIGW